MIIIIHEDMNMPGWPGEAEKDVGWLVCIKWYGLINRRKETKSIVNICKVDFLANQYSSGMWRMFIVTS